MTKNPFQFFLVEDQKLKRLRQLTERSSIDQPSISIFLVEDLGAVPWNRTLGSYLGAFLGAFLGAVPWGRSLGPFCGAIPTRSAIPNNRQSALMVELLCKSITRVQGLELGPTMDIVDQ